MLKKHKTLLTIAAVAVMLLAASTAYGYHERWGGWFSEGTLTLGDYKYTLSGPGGAACDSTVGSIDAFYLPALIRSIFVCTSGSDIIILDVTSFTGSKPTGEDNTKEGSGTWSGIALCTGPGHPDVPFDPVRGTWKATFDYTDYPQRTPTYTGTWKVTYSNPEGLGGDGTSSGSRTDRW